MKELLEHAPGEDIDRFISRIFWPLDDGGAAGGGFVNRIWGSFTDPITSLKIDILNENVNKLRGLWDDYDTLQIIHTPHMDIDKIKALTNDQMFSWVEDFITACRKKFTKANWVAIETFKKVAMAVLLTKFEDFSNDEYLKENWSTNPVITRKDAFISLYTTAVIFFPFAISWIFGAQDVKRQTEIIRTTIFFIYFECLKYWELNLN